MVTTSGELVCKTICLSDEETTPLSRFIVCSVVLRVLTVWKLWMRVCIVRMAKQQQTRTCGCCHCSKHSG